MKKFNTRLLFVLSIAIILMTSLPSCSKHTDNAGDGSLDLPSYLTGLDAPVEDLTKVEVKDTEAITNESVEVPTELPEPEPSLEYKSFGNGTCAIIGIGDISDPYVIIPEKSPNGDIVTTIEDEAFFGNSFITVIQISSTVHSIGNKAFANCKNLVHIELDEKNSHFYETDGVLFDSNMSRLMCYPSAKTSSTLNLPKTVTAIDDMALYGCNNLISIIYEGSADEWSAVILGEKNYGIYTASLIFEGK